MIRTHALLYFGSRIAAAAANLAAVTVFTRLAAAEVYGGSLLVFAWAFVLFGFTGQWLGASFFAIHRQADVAAQVAVLVRLASAALAVSGLSIAVACLAGLVAPAFGATVLVTTAGLLLFVTMTEIERTRLQATRVAVMYIARAVLTLALGTGALLAGGGSLALALALALASIAAALPSLARLRRDILRRPDRAALREVVHYGWPLVIAFGTMAVGQNVDRFLLVRMAGVEQLGAYGATSDFLKQGLGVICEAITLASISVAKDLTTRGHRTASRVVLEDAFRAVVVTIAFGAAVMILFSKEIVEIVFGPAFREAARDVFPWLIVANAALVLRAFYFGQAIYFGQSSRNEAVASLSMITVTGVLALLCIPPFGVYGAAMAATGGQLAACAIFAVARPRMPIPALSAFCILLAALAAAAAALLIGRWGPLGAAERNAVQFLILLAAGGGVVWGYDILGLRTAAQSLVRLPRGARR